MRVRERSATRAIACTPAPCRARPRSLRAPVSRRRAIDSRTLILRTALALWLCASFLASAAATAAAAPTPARHLLIVVGLGGEDYYSSRFRGWAETMVQAAERRLGIPASRITVLSEDRAGPTRSTAANVLAALARLTERSRAGDLVLVLLIGHGTAQGGRARFNLPGPDLAPEELARGLAPLRDRRLAVVDAAPASAPFIAALSAPGRIVVSATASAAEDQHTLFAGHFVDAFASGAGDRDKDGRISLLEAFLYAERATRRDFEESGRLVTEHPLLDDDGDGSGSLAARLTSGTSAAAVAGGHRDGALAAGFVLREPDAHGHDLERLALDAAARRLADAVAAHARLKPTMRPLEYEARLEALLLELALNRRAAEAHR